MVKHDDHMSHIYPQIPFTIHVVVFLKLFRTQQPRLFGPSLTRALLLQGYQETPLKDPLVDKMM